MGIQLHMLSIPTLHNIPKVLTGKIRDVWLWINNPLSLADIMMLILVQLPVVQQAESSLSHLMSINPNNTVLWLCDIYTCISFNIALSWHIAGT